MGAVRGKAQRCEAWRGLAAAHAQQWQRSEGAGVLRGRAQQRVPGAWAGTRDGRSLGRRAVGAARAAAVLPVPSSEPPNPLETLFGCGRCAGKAGWGVMAGRNADTRGSCGSVLFVHDLCCPCRCLLCVTASLNGPGFWAMALQQYGRDACGTWATCQAGCSWFPQASFAAAASWRAAAPAWAAGPAKTTVVRQMDDSSSARWAYGGAKLWVRAGRVCNLCGVQGKGKLPIPALTSK